MNTNYETEVVRRVFDNDCGEAITVGPSADFPGNVMLYTEDKYKEYFGEIRLDLPLAMMRKIAEALLAACTEAEAA
jgi:hypothetical protein